MYTSILIAAFAGGIVRGLTGFVKHWFSYKKVEFNLSYFVSTTLISGGVGLATAIAIKELGVSTLGIETLSTPVAFIIGYAGGDFLENVYKILLKKK